jgi:ADP-L-glycero-D-manno-heptose 6-epimerase
MKILVTGHQGFIGKNLSAYLKNEFEVFGYEWSESEFPSVSEYDWVIHLGAISSTTEKDVDKIMRQNYEFSKRLFNECNKHGVNLQYASSASVYGNNTDFKESSPKQPSSPYAWSKYLFDRWVFQQPQDIIVQGFRYFNVYGPDEDHKGDQASPYTKFSKQAKETGAVTLFKGSEDFKRDFICVNDICEVQKLMLNINQSDIWNLGSGTATSFETVGRLIAQKYNATLNYIDMPDNLKKQYQSYTCADMTALNNIINKKFIDIKDYINGSN